MDSAFAGSDALTVIVITSRGKDKFVFDKPTTVAKAIDEIRDRFGLKGSGEFTLIRNLKNEPLTPKKELLVNFGIEDGEELTLTGGGVNV